MVGLGLGDAGNRIAELIGHPKMRSEPIKLIMLVIILPRSNECIPVAQFMRVQVRNGKVKKG